MSFKMLLTNGDTTHTPILVFEPLAMSLYTSFKKLTNLTPRHMPVPGPYTWVQVGSRNCKRLRNNFNDCPKSLIDLCTKKMSRFKMAATYLQTYLKVVMERSFADNLNIWGSPQTYDEYSDEGLALDVRMLGSGGLWNNLTHVYHI